MAKVSVIVPVYNVEKYLPACLDSLLGQTLKDIEIICVNDGSSDSSPGIIKEYMSKDDRIKTIDQKNMGVACARNAGLKLVTAPYVMWCDPDDTYKPQMCETMYRAMVETDVDIACCEPEIHYYADTQLKKSDDSYYTLKYSGLSYNIKDIINKLDGSLVLKIFKNSLIDKYKISCKERMLYEDSNFLWKYLVISKNCYFIKEKLYIYNRREGSIMNKTFNKNKKSIEHIYIADDIYDYLNKNDLFQRYKNEFAQFYMASYYFVKRFIPLSSMPYFLYVHSRLLKKYDLENGLNVYLKNIYPRNEVKNFIKKIF